MSILERSLLIITTLIVVFLVSVRGEFNGLETRKLDETGGIKCGGCSPCGSSSCYLSPPPPSLPPPSPAPPPPPKKKPPTTPYCPPPPYQPSSSPGAGTGGSGFVYMTAPPGELYPVVRNYNGSPRSHGDAITTILAVFGLVGLLLMA